jgi:hypothetical protein
MGRNKNAQIWVETVIYTLIGIAIIGLVLAVAKPKIDAKKDEIVIEQAIESLGNIDDKIYEVQKAVGNRRSVDLKVGKGKIIFDMDNDIISWVIGSSFEYSENEVVVPLGRINVTTRGADPFEVTLTMGYGVEILYDEEFTGTKELNSAPTPYHLTIENDGVYSLTGKLKVDIKEV